MAIGDRNWGRRAVRLPRSAYRDELPVHVVLGTFRRRPVLARAAVAGAVFRVVRNHPATLAGCLMPDHLHWLLRDGRELSATVARFKAYSTRGAWSAGHQGRLWQRSFYDHALRRSESVVDVIAYLVANPVRAGLAATVDEWPFVFVADL